MSGFRVEPGATGDFDQAHDISRGLERHWPIAYAKEYPVKAREALILLVVTGIALVCAALLL